MSLRVYFTRVNILKLTAIAIAILGISLSAQMFVISRITSKVELELSTAQPAHSCSYTKETKSALRRVKTETCRNQIENLACQLEQGNYFPSSVPHFCPKSEIISYGCYVDADGSLLKEYFNEFPETNSVQSCIAQCFHFGFKLAGVENGIECHCANEFSKDKKIDDITDCQLSKCPGNESEFCGGPWRVLVFSTGIPVVNRTFAEPNQMSTISNSSTNTEQCNDIRIVFHISVAGRYLRQVLRLLKAIYSPKHYYFIHVDKQDEYLFRELSKLVGQTDNIKYQRHRHTNIWGGISHLALMLESIREIFEVYSHWKWDFFMDLSESHFPLFPISELEAFLSANRQWNFAERLYWNGDKFIEKMGYDWTFLECEAYLWRLAKRKVPKNLRIEGNSDWFTLNREFLHYVTYSEDELVKGLKLYHRHALSAMETFFQILLVNSRFCHTFAGISLQFISWGKPGKACHCETVVDWCGCSPLALTTEWATNLNYTNMLMEHRYVARKFDPTVYLEAINIVERNFFNRTYNGKLNAANFDDNSYKSFWFNDFHYLDTNTKTDPEKLTLLHSWLHVSLNQSLSSDMEIVEADVQELTVLLHKSQVFLLLKYNVHTKAGEIAQFETKFQYIENAIRTTFDNRITQVEVGTNWDVRIDNFRNYAKSFGPTSTMGLRVVTNSTEVLHLRSVWYNPSALEQGTVELTTTAASNIWLLKWSENKYKEPGIWTVYLLVNGTLTAQLKFPVLPNRKTKDLKYSAGEQIDNISLDLITSFYAAVDNCIVDSSGTKIFDLVQKCESAQWSSVSPDPKSSFDVASASDVL